MLRILAYHRVAELQDTPLVDSRSVSATPKEFIWQMNYLASHYHTISMPQLLNAVETGSRLPKRAVLITFDDAYADFAETAWPVLKRFGLCATLFVPTGYPNHPERPFSWDQLYQAFGATRRTELRVTPFGALPLGKPEQKRRALRMVQDHLATVADHEAMRLVDSVCSQLVEKRECSGSVLTWNQLRQLRNEGLTLGSHTRTHPIMTQVSPDRMREEIRTSQQDLRTETGSALPIFCYPNGDHNDIIISILREEGIRLAFTTRSGPNDSLSWDPLKLRRIVITPRTSRTVFRIRLLRLGAYFDSCRHGIMKRKLARSPFLYRGAASEAKPKTSDIQGYPEQSQ